MNNAEQTAEAAAAFVLDDDEVDDSQSNAADYLSAAASATRPLELVDDRAQREQEASAIRDVQQGDRKLHDILRRQSAARRKHGLANSLGVYKQKQLREGASHRRQHEFPYV